MSYGYPFVNEALIQANPDSEYVEVELSPMLVSSQLFVSSLTDALMYKKNAKSIRKNAK